jgi:hypothetical protein
MEHRQTKILRPDGRWEVRCSVHDKLDGPYPQTFPNEVAADQYAELHLMAHRGAAVTTNNRPGNTSK